MSISSVRFWKLFLIINELFSVIHLQYKWISLHFQVFVSVLCQTIILGKEKFKCWTNIGEWSKENWSIFKKILAWNATNTELSLYAYVFTRRYWYWNWEKIRLRINWKNQKRNNVSKYDRKFKIILWWLQVWWNRIHQRL